LRNAPLLKTLDLFRFGLVCLCAAILLSCSAGCSVSNSNSSAATVAPAQASTVLTGKVVGIVDGDTIDVLDSNRNTHRVRLAGIDAPEARQAFGARSTQNLTALVRESAVRVEWYKLDDWQRLVGKVLKNDQDICLEQVRAGFAWHFKRYEDEQSEEDRRIYDAAEKEARSAKKGLWKDLVPIEPWLYRNRQREHSQASKFIPDVPDTNAAEVAVDEPEVPAVAQEGNIRGNRRSMIYHWPGCPNYDDIAFHNRVPFQTRQEAERAGYRAARNCR
jgi:endonuclease YncB( thermonuclease family)